MSDKPTLDDIAAGVAKVARKSTADAKDLSETQSLEAERKHELDLLKAQMGPIGRLIGSNDTPLTIAFFVVALCGALLAIHMIASMFSNGMRDNLADNLVKVLLAALAYMFGRGASVGEAVKRKR